MQLDKTKSFLDVRNGSGLPFALRSLTSSADPIVEVDGLFCRLGAHDVLRDVTLSVAPGEIVGILGPNGCGKTTLLRCIAGLQKPTRGSVRVLGRDLATLSPAAIARHLAYQAQDQFSDLGFSVRDVVGMGRLAHRSGPFDRGGLDAEGIVARCIAALDLGALADRSFADLSGGERQRVAIARALAQEAAVLALDEPTNHLDVRHRFSVLETVRALGIAVVATLHEIELSGRFCDRVVLLRDGVVLADGAPADALTEANIGLLYDVDSHVDCHPATRHLRIDLQPRRKIAR